MKDFRGRELFFYLNEGLWFIICEIKIRCYINSLGTDFISVVNVIRERGYSVIKLAGERVGVI